jgi:hypothetical protein
MPQGLRELLANRRFAIPLIVLLAFCLIGLLLIGVVLIWQPGSRTAEEPVAQATLTATSEPEDTATPVPTATNTPTPRPSPTLVPVGTVDTVGATEEPTTVSTSDEASGATPGSETGTAVVSAATTTAPTPEEGVTSQPTSETENEDDELAQTGVGWGLILISGAGLASLVVAARRLRLAA